MKKCKALFFINLFLCFTANCYSQGFHRLYGTSGSDDFSSILLLSNGDNIISGTVSNGSIGGSDIYITRVNSIGNIVWQYLYGGSSNDVSYVSVINANGNIVIAGTSTSFKIGSDVDLFLLEIDLNGLLIWSRSYGKIALDEIPRNITLTPTGIVLCATIGSPGTTSPDILVLEVSNDGVTINWQNVIGVSGGYGDIPSSIIPSRLGGYIIVGGSHDPSVGYDQVVWRLNSLGKLQSNIAFGSSSNENAQSLIELANNDIVVMGNFRTLSGSGLEFSLSSIKSNNAFNWIRTYGDNGIRDERAFGFLQTSTGGYGFCGYTNGLGAGGNDILFVRTDGLGQLLSYSSFGDTGNETSTGLVQNSDNGFTIAGISNSAGSGGNDTYLIRTDANGIAANTCSSYSIVQRSLSLSSHSYVYSESNPLLSNNSVSFNRNVLSLNNVIFNCSTLPLELIDFRVVFTDNISNTLRWVTLNEDNLCCFEIEKTYDGLNWESIIRLKSSGAYGAKEDYSYVDYEASSKCVYYRLKQIDYDGTYSYSKIIKNCVELDESVIYPNPTKRYLNFKRLSLNNDSLIDVSIKDLNGIEVNDVFYFNQIGDNEIVIDFQNLDAGIYLVSIICENKLLVKRVIKE